MVMGKSRKKNQTAQTRRDRASRGHNVAVAFGGNRDVWVWICMKCNQEQGSMSFFDWAMVLKERGDQRWLDVLGLHFQIRAWCSRNGVSELAWGRRWLK